MEVSQDLGLRGPVRLLDNPHILFGFAGYGVYSTAELFLDGDRDTDSTLLDLHR
jgi:hypothetical protein